MKTNPPMPEARDGPRPRPWQLRVGFWLLLAIAAFYLLTEHRAHLALGLSYLPLLLLAACPLIHMLGHGGHGGHGGHRGHGGHSRHGTPGISPPDHGAQGGTESRPDAPPRHQGDLP